MSTIRKYGTGITLISLCLCLGLAAFVSQFWSTKRSSVVEETSEAASPFSQRRESRQTERRSLVNRAHLNSAKMTETYRSLVEQWDSLERSGANTERRSLLAEETAKQLLFSPEMELILDYVKEHNIKSGEGLEHHLYQQLVGMKRDVAVESLASNPGILTRFRGYDAFIEAAVRGLTESEFEGLKFSLGEKSNEFAMNAQLHRNIHRVQENPVERIMFSLDILGDKVVNGYGKDHLKKMISNIPADKSMPFKKIVETMRSRSHPNSVEAGKTVFPQVYQRWAMADPDAALRHSSTTFPDNDYISDVVAGVYYRQKPLKMVTWLDSIENKKVADQARSIMARRLGGDAIYSRVVAAGIINPQLREETFQSIVKREESDAIEFDAANR